MAFLRQSFLCGGDLVFLGLQLQRTSAIAISDSEFACGLLAGITVALKNVEEVDC